MELLSVCNLDSAYGSHSDASNNPEKQSAENLSSKPPLPLPLQPPEILAPYCPPKLNSVFISNGKIYVDQFCFSKGDLAYLFDNGFTYSIKLIQIGKEQVVIARADGSKSVLNVELLMDGLVTLIPKIHSF